MVGGAGTGILKYLHAAPTINARRMLDVSLI
jgi:hypothetical protein